VYTVQLACPVVGGSGLKVSGISAPLSRCTKPLMHKLSDYQSTEGLAR